MQNGERVTGSSFLLIAAETARRSRVFVGVWGCGRVLFIFEWKCISTSLQAFTPQLGNAETEVKLRPLTGLVSLDTKCDKINIERGVDMQMRRKCREILREQMKFSRK